jgi:hypothetical protein
MTLGKSRPIYAVPETGQGVRRSRDVASLKALPVLLTMVSIPRRAKESPSVGMTDLKAYGNTNSFNKPSISTENPEAPTVVPHVTAQVLFR